MIKMHDDVSVTYDSVARRWIARVTTDGHSTLFTSKSITVLREFLDNRGIDLKEIKNDKDQ